MSSWHNDTTSLCTTEEGYIAGGKGYSFYYLIALWQELWDYIPAHNYQPWLMTFNVTIRTHRDLCSRYPTFQSS